MPGYMGAGKSVADTTLVYKTVSDRPAVKSSDSNLVGVPSGSSFVVTITMKFSLDT